MVLCCKLTKSADTFRRARVAVIASAVGSGASLSRWMVESGSRALWASTYAGCALSGNALGVPGRLASSGKLEGRRFCVEWAAIKATEHTATTRATPSAEAGLQENFAIASRYRPTCSQAPRIFATWPTGPQPVYKG